MNPFSFLYRELVYRPLANGLAFFYGALPYRDLGVAIFLLTVSVRLLLLPLSVRSTRMQRAMEAIQPKVRDVNERFKNDPERKTRETLALYRANRIQPFAMLGSLLFQLPVLIGLYYLLWKGIHPFDPTLLYAVSSNALPFHPIAFGVLDLSKPNLFLAFAAGAAQFFQGRISQRAQPKPRETGFGSEFAKSLRWQTTYILPAFMIVFLWQLPAAVGLYWTVFSLLAIVEHLWIERRLRSESGAAP